MADYLIGDAASFSQATYRPHPYAFFHTISPYIQDQWKVTRRLTLSGGLRWEFYPNANGEPGYESIFDPATYRASEAPIVNANGTVTATANYNPTNGLILDGINGIPLNFSTEHENYWAPSLGFAWDVFGDGNTALRGGYGINYQFSSFQGPCMVQCANNPPLVSTLSLVTPSFPDPLGAAATPLAASSLQSED